MRASALRRMGMSGEFNFRGRNPVKIRYCQYLNNVVEQHSPHRRSGLLVLSLRQAYMHQNSLLGYLGEVVIECCTSLVACECRIRGDRPRRPKTAYACV